MSNTTANKKTGSQIFFSIFSDDPFERFVAFLIALAMLLAAVVGFLQADAGARADRYNRNAQQFAVQAMGRQISGATQVAYAWSDAYQAWDELNTLALAATGSEDDAAARYKAVRDRVAKLSPLLTTPYFDPTGQDVPDIAGYEADIYLVETTALTERYTAAAELDDAWGGKANAYVAHLTLLAVTLFLFGLSITVEGWIRWFLLGTGLFITAITFIWMLAVIIWPVPNLSDQAIVAYARGVGLVHRGDMEEAIVAFDQALAEAPDYANVFYERGNAQYYLSNYEAAAADYEAAQTAGRDDVNVAWNLGWLYYLLGRFDAAAQMDRHALELDPDRLWIRFNLSLALLAAGQIEAAQTEYTSAMDAAKQQVKEAREMGLEPSSSLWWYLDAAARDIDSLIDRLNNQPKFWTEAPSPETIDNPEQVKTTAQEWRKQLKDLTVALEYTGEPPSGLVTAQISPFQFGQATYDDEGNFLDYNLAETFPPGTDEVLILYDYEGMQDGQDIIWKVYRDGEEDPSLRVVEEWLLGEAGGAEKAISYAYSRVFIFWSGEYTVEMYVNSRLMQTGHFIIAQE